MSGSTGRSSKWLECWNEGSEAGRAKAITNDMDVVENRGLVIKTSSDTIHVRSPTMSYRLAQVKGFLR